MARTSPGHAVVVLVLFVSAFACRDSLVERVEKRVVADVGAELFAELTSSDVGERHGYVMCITMQKHEMRRYVARSSRPEEILSYFRQWSAETKSCRQVFPVSEPWLSVLSPMC